MSHAGTEDKKGGFETRSVSADELIAKLSGEKQDLEVDKYFRALVKLEGSDLHMKVGKPPMVRIRNELRPLSRGPVERAEMVKLLVPMMNDRSRRIFEMMAFVDYHSIPCRNHRGVIPVPRHPSHGDVGHEQVVIHHYDVRSCSFASCIEEETLFEVRAFLSHAQIRFGGDFVPHFRRRRKAHVAQ